MKSILTGRIASEPIKKTGSNNMVVSTFQLAIKRSEGGAVFVKCMAKGQLAQVVLNYCKKGRLIAVEGDMVDAVFEIEELQLLDPMARVHSKEWQEGYKVAQ